MRRRDLLKMTALASCAPLIRGVHAASAPIIGAAPLRRVRPSDPSWPDAEQWAQLKESVGGHLIEVQPMFAACGKDPQGPACLDALKNIRNPYWIADQPAGTEVSGWLDAWTPMPSAYAINARSAPDVAAGIHFARKHHLRLAVKGGAHSYQGTSNAPDSLLIWTRAMNAVALHDAFVGKGCEGRAAPVPAVSAGAGAVWADLYYAVSVQAGRYVQGGSCTTVGVAGIIQSGGFNWFSKRFGTAASSLLEAEVVTADGQVRVVNACNEPDLFWALKGGGGGTFGVVTRVTLRTHDLPSFIGGAGAKIKAQSDEAFRKLITRFIDFYHDHLFNPHWGNNVDFSPDNTLEISLSSQGLTNAQVAEVWKLFVDWVRSSPAHFSFVSPPGSAAIDPHKRSLLTGNDWIHDPRDGAIPYHVWNRGDQGECGAFWHGYESLWLPASLLRRDRRALLADALFAASRHKRVSLHLCKGLAGGSDEARKAALQTAMNPAVVNAFTLAIIADGEGPQYPGMPHPALDLAGARRDARAIDLAADELRKIVPHPGSYVSESNYFNPSWQRAFWGEHYPRLRAIKKRYDPDGLFIVHHGVGSEEWSADGFERL
ncbi:MAG: FAD-binding protein [Steroidobacteraceae bacterium]